MTKKQPRIRLSDHDAMPRDLSYRALRAGDSELVLLSFTPTGASSLTEAERDVALAIARGLSNAEIARARSTSARTIANQIAAIMKKLGVASRVELAARIGPADFV